MKRLEGAYEVAMPDAKPASTGWAWATPGGRFTDGRGALRGVST